MPSAYVDVTLQSSEGCNLAFFAAAARLSTVKAQSSRIVLERAGRAAGSAVTRRIDQPPRRTNEASVTYLPSAVKFQSLMTKGPSVGRGRGRLLGFRGVRVLGKLYGCSAQDLEYKYSIKLLYEPKTKV